MRVAQQGLHGHGLVDVELGAEGRFLHRPQHGGVMSRQVGTLLQVQQRHRPGLAQAACAGLLLGHQNGLDASGPAGLQQPDQAVSGAVGPGHAIGAGHCAQCDDGVERLAPAVGRRADGEGHGGVGRRRRVAQQQGTGAAGEQGQPGMAAGAIAQVQPLNQIAQRGHAGGPVAQPGREQQVAELLLAGQPPLGVEQQVEAAGVAWAVTQALVDGLLPDAPEGVGVGIAAARLAGDKTARGGPLRRGAARQQGQRIDPGQRLGQQLLALAGFGHALFERGLEGGDTGLEMAVGDVGAGPKRVAGRAGQAVDHAPGLAGLATEHQAAGQGQAHEVVQGGGVGLAAVVQPGPQRRGDRFIVGQGQAQQLAQQLQLQFGVHALPSHRIKRPQQGQRQMHRVDLVAPGQTAQPLVVGQTAAGPDHHAQRAHQRGVVELFQMPAGVKTHQSTPGRPPAVAAGRLVHQFAKAARAQRGQGLPAALVVMLDQALGFEFGQQRSQHLGAEGAAALGLPVAMGQHFAQPVDGARCLHEAQAIEHKAGVGIGRWLAGIGLVGQQGQLGVWRWHGAGRGLGQTSV